MLKAAVFASGNGSNFQAIVDASNSNEIAIEIVVLVCNNKDAYVIERAKQSNIEVIIIDYKSNNKEVIERDLIDKLRPYNLDYIFLAGFLRVFSPLFIEAYANKIINIHPSLLPKYKGLHAIEQALDNNDDIIGISVHYVNELLDSGAIILQDSFSIKDMNRDDVYQAVHQREHRLYIEAIKKVVLDNE